MIRSAAVVHYVKLSFIFFILNLENIYEYLCRYSQNQRQKIINYHLIGFKFTFKYVYNLFVSVYFIRGDDMVF